MTFKIKTRNKEQEKYLFAFVKSLEELGITVERENVSSANTAKKKPMKTNNAADKLLSMQGMLKGLNPDIDYRYERIMNKHK